MANPYEFNNPGVQEHEGYLNGQHGKWVPVDPETVPFPVSNDPANPTMDGSGDFYYAQGGAPAAQQQPVQQGGPAPIAANQMNAIPTPSSIVQLPPIVQPIALVPFASQSQPLVQYDASYREEIPKTNLEPIYMAKPYAGLSVLCILLAIIAAVIMCLLACVKIPDAEATATATGLDTIFGLVAMFGVGGLSSAYYDHFLSVVAPDGFAGISMQGIFGVIIPIFYALALVCAIIAIIYYLVKLGKRKSPRGFFVVSLLGLIFAIGALILMIVTEQLAFAVGAIVVAVLFLILLIVPFFAKKGAQVVDYSASKRLYSSVN